MNSFELNKMIGALLATVFIVLSLGIVSNAIFAAPVPEKPGYAIEAAESSASEAGGEAAPAESILPLLASASIDNGMAQFKKCQACHTGENGGPNKVGPNLWNIVNRPIASHEGFSYSSAMKEFSQGGSVHWDFEHLDHFLLSPKGLVKGTAMGFAGLKKLQDRADLVAYLHTLSDSPAPFPDASAAPAATDAAAPAQAAPAEAAPAAPAAEPAPAQ
ncbi:MAG: cytochrome c family protein [Rhizobiaceae bacterium]|nr:cytochrome c family protein [Rhizobiaceae bacterium]